MAPSVATDYAVAEKLKKFIVIPAKFNWSDVGDWAEVWKHLPKDSQGNVILGLKGRGQLVGLESQNNLLILDKQLIALVGLKDMIVVDTPDAILIGPKDNAEAVKKIVEALKEQKSTEYI